MAKNKDRLDEALDMPGMADEPSLAVLNLPPADLAIKKIPTGRLVYLTAVGGNGLCSRLKSG